MTMSASYVNGQFLEDALSNAVAFDLVQAGTSTMKVFLVKDAITGQDKNAAEAYASTYEVANSGTYAAGGDALTGTTLASAAGVLTFDETDSTMAWTSATWGATAAPIGCGIYDTTLSNRLICYIKFGSSEITVTSGSFTITWDSSGIWTATY